MHRNEPGSRSGPALRQAEGHAYFFDYKGRLECRETFDPQERMVAYACYDTLGRLVRRKGI